MFSKMLSTASCGLVFPFFFWAGAVLAASVLSADDVPVVDQESTLDARADDEVAERIRAYRKVFDDRKIEMRQHREEMQRRVEARRQVFAERMDAMMEKHAAWQAEMAKRHETLRQRAKEDRDYIYDHRQELLATALKRRDAMIQYYEEKRQQAELRKDELEKYRLTLQNMSPDEWSAYFKEHQLQMKKVMQPPLFQPRDLPPSFHHRPPYTGMHPVPMAPEPSAGKAG